MHSRAVILLAYILFSIQLSGQELPTGKNKHDRNGERTGEWVIWMNSDWKPTENPDSAAYFRKVKYKKGYPKGAVSDHFLDGSIQMSAQFKDKECKVFHGHVYWYNKKGQVSNYKHYRNGELDKNRSLSRLIEILEGEEANQIDSLTRADISMTVTQYYLEKEGEEALKKCWPYTEFASIVYRDDPEKYATACMILGPIYQKLELNDKAIEMYEVFVPFLKNLVGEINPYYHQFHRLLADLYYEEDLYEKAIEAYQHQLGLVRMSKGEETEEFCDALEDLAKSYSWNMQYPEAISTYTERIEILKKIQGKKYDSYPMDLNWLAYRYKRQYEYDTAMSFNRRAAEIFEHRGDTINDDYAEIMEDIGSIFHDQTIYKPALDYYEKAYNLRQQIGAMDPDDEIDYLLDIAVVATKIESFDRAIVSNKRAISLAKDHFGAESEDYVNALQYMSHIYYERNMNTETRYYAQLAKDVYEQNHMNDPELYMRILNSLSLVFKASGELERASDLAGKAVKIAEKHYGKLSKRYIIMLSNLGVIYNAQERSDEAYDLYKKVYQLRMNMDQKDWPGVANVCNNLGIYLSSEHQYDSAIYYLSQAHEINQRLFGDSHSSTAQNKVDLASIYAELYQFDLSDSLMYQALNYYQSNADKNPRAYAYGLDEYATMIKSQGKKKTALEYYERAFGVADKYLDEKNPTRLKILGNTGLCYKQMGQFNKADSIYDVLLDLERHRLGRETNYASILEKKASLASDLRSYQESVKLFMLADSMRRKVHGLDHPNTWNVWSNLSSTYLQMGLLQKSDSLNKIVMQKRKDFFGENHPDYLSNLVRQEVIYSNQGRFMESHDLSKVILDKKRALLGENHPDYANALSNYAISCANLGLSDIAVKMLTKAVSINERAYSREHFETISKMRSLAIQLHELGRYEEALNLYKEVLDLAEKTFGKQSPVYADYLDDLAGYYKEMGDTSEAERLLNTAYRSLRKVYGEDCFECIGTITELANLSDDLGRNEVRDQYYQEALRLTEKYYGTDHYNYATALSNIAGTLRGKKNYAYADSLYKVALRIDKKYYGENHLQYAVTLSNYANFLSRNNHSDSAIYFGKMVYDIYTKVLPKYHPNKALILNNLSQFYPDSTRNNESDSLLILAQNIVERTVGQSHDLYSTIMSNRSLIPFKKGEYVKAFDLWLKTMQVDLNRLRTQFPSMSEREKKQFWKTTDMIFEMNHTFSVLLQEERPDALDIGYDNLLATKAMLMDASVKMKNAVVAANDPEIDSIFVQWKLSREELVGVQQQSPEEQEKDPKALRKTINTLEKQLFELTSVTGNDDGRELHWKDIREQLRSNEAAVEIVRFKWFERSWTDSVLYAAYIIKKDSDHPDLVILPNGEYLETRQLKRYRGSIHYRVPDPYSYDQYWRPIEESLDGIDKVYLSPDGVYNQVNLNTLWNTSTDEFLLNEIDIQMVTSTRELVDEQQYSNKKNKRALLLGRPAYSIENMYDVSIDTAGSPVVSPQRGMTQRSLERMFGEEIADLPGTEEEVTFVKSLLSESDWETEMYLQESAEEHILKSVKSPRVLHIATHGFFFPDSKNSKTGKVDPMMRSGVLLAGVSDYYLGKRDVRTDDGILTAYEATSLDLNQTDLVVLSACETGLGELSSGEGVYGLQRGFEIAGAKNILMSLWKVDDEATQKLMSHFYSEWLENNDIKSAFKQAQIKLQEQYHDPYFWGAFVLVGTPD